MNKMLLSHQVEDIKSILEERAKHNLFLLNGTNSSCNPGLPSWPQKYEAAHQNKTRQCSCLRCIQGYSTCSSFVSICSFCHKPLFIVQLLICMCCMYYFLIENFHFFIRNLRVLKHLLYLPTLPDQSDFAPVKELSHHQLNLLFSHEPRSLSGKKPRFKSINNSFHTCKVPFPLFVVF